MRKYFAFLLFWFAFCLYAEDKEENKYHGTDNELCSIYRDNDYAGLEDLLWAYYETRYVKKPKCNKFIPTDCNKNRNLYVTLVKIH